MFKKTVKTHFIKAKPSLGAVLVKTLQLQWDEIKTLMNKFPYFKHWPDKSVHQFCVHSTIVSYNEDDVLFVKDESNVFVVHFIIEGSATIIQRLVVSKKIRKGDMRVTYKLHKDQNADTSKNDNLETVFMQTCHLLEGACFGLGERLSDHIIKANKGLKCIVVPKLIIFQDYAPDNVWRRIILFMDISYPSLEEVFQHFVRGRDWIKYSKQQYNHLKEDRVSRVETDIHDVPISSRLQDLTLLGKLLKRF